MINYTNEAVVNVLNLLLLCFIQDIDMGRRSNCDLSTEGKREKNSQENRNEGTRKMSSYFPHYMSILVFKILSDRKFKITVLNR